MGDVPRSSLPELSIGDEVAGCTYLGSTKGGPTGGQTWWKLRCVCGFEFERRASEHWYHAKRGEKKLCKNKHLHTEIGIGSKFGKLIITGFDKVEIETTRGTERRGYAVCDCICGTKGFRVLPESLRNGDTQSCGCYLKEATGDRFRLHGKTHTKEFKLWYSAKERATRKDIPFDIELSDIVIPDTCPVLGIPLDKENVDKRINNSPSLDKFFPDRGYVKGNIQVISWRANRIKSDGTPEEWRKIADWCQREEVKRKIIGEDI
jgi:hypothetical protein